MARESTAFVGSGVQLLRNGEAPGFPQAVSAVAGTNTIVHNYEDIHSKMGVVQASGLAVDGSAVHLNGPATRLRGRRQVMIQNLSADAVFIGDSTVTTATGLRIAQGEILTLDVLDHGDIFVVGAGASDVRILEIK